MADNASAMQKVLSDLEHIGDTTLAINRDVEVGEPIDDEPTTSKCTTMEAASNDEINNVDEETDLLVNSEQYQSCLDGVSYSCSDKGIFALRCASHSFQLLLKDILTSIESVMIAKEKLDTSLTLFAKSPEATEK